MAQSSTNGRGSDQVPVTPIPSPPGYPLIGNLLDLDAETPADSLRQIWKTYGEIWKLRIAGREPIFVNSVALADALCDETK
jgi:cytochrome P450/NADPH-cytochrome P450 reductase